MAKNSIEVYGATGKTNVLTFDPASLHLVTDPAHPLFDERVFLPLDEAMVLNIMDMGVIQAILVWKDPETGKTLVVAGRQRVKHTLEANRRLVDNGKEPLLIPAMVRRGRTALQVAGAMVSENEIRKPDTPLGRANKMAAMLNQGRSEGELALLFGCSAITVRSTLALLDCTAAVKNAVEAGQINTTHAKALAKLSPDEQREKVSELINTDQGEKPHERAQRQARVIGAAPKMKSRAQIQKALEEAQGEYATALRWVLGVPANDES